MTSDEGRLAEIRRALLEDEGAQHFGPSHTSTGRNAHWWWLLSEHSRLTKALADRDAEIRDDD